MTILFQSSWSSYEEGASVIIFERDNVLFARKVGHSVMIGDFDSTYEVSQDEALEIMLEEIDDEDVD